MLDRHVGAIRCPGCQTYCHKRLFDGPICKLCVHLLLVAAHGEPPLLLAGRYPRGGVPSGT